MNVFQSHVWDVWATYSENKGKRCRYKSVLTDVFEFLCPCRHQSSWSAQELTFVTGIVACPSFRSFYGVAMSKPEMERPDDCKQQKESLRGYDYFNEKSARKGWYARDTLGSLFAPFLDGALDDDGHAGHLLPAASQGLQRLRSLPIHRLMFI